MTLFRRSQDPYEIKLSCSTGLEKPKLTERMVLWVIELLEDDV